MININCIYFSDRNDISVLGISLEVSGDLSRCSDDNFTITISTNDNTEAIITKPKKADSPLGKDNKTLIFDIPLPWKIAEYRDVEITVSTRDGLSLIKKTKFGKKLRWRLIDKIKITGVFSFTEVMERGLISYLLKLTGAQIFLHCWNPEISGEVIKKISRYSSLTQLTLIKPVNICSANFDEIHDYAVSMNFKSLDVLSAPAEGRDIGGFISALVHQLDKGDRSPCLILHSKNTEFLPKCLSEDWRNSLIDPLISGMSGILALLKISFFGSALVCSEKNMRQDSPLSSGWKKLHPLQKESYNLASDLSLRIFKEKYDSFTYCAGTMMWVNPNKMRDVWTRERLVAFLGLLEPSENLTEPSHAHAFERLFSEALLRHGKKVSEV